MATRTLNTTHAGLERVLRAAGAFSAFTKTAWTEARATAHAQREWLKLLELSRTDSRLRADLCAAKLRAERDSE